MPVASEMLSGPDLGGGYLHQLTLDRDGPRTTFTFHAQDGGQDAGGPSKGPLDRFGWVHPPTPCPFGGPRCFHRRFLLPFSETARVRAAYNRTRFVLQTMLDQAYDGAPVAWEPALKEVVGRVAVPFAEARIPWYVGGIAAARLLGAAVAPSHLLLGTSRPGVDRLAERIGEYLIEPVGPTDWPDSGIVHAARGFVGTFQAGARVLWGVRIEAAEEEFRPETAGAPARVRTLPVSVGGVEIAVARPEYALVRAAERGRRERVGPLVEAIRGVGVDRALLEERLARSSLAAPARDDLVRALGV